MGFMTRRFARSLPSQATGKFNELYNDSSYTKLGLVTSLLYLLMSYPLSLFARR